MSSGVGEGFPYVRLGTLKKLRSVSTRPGVTCSVQCSCDGKSRQFSVI